MKKAGKMDDNPDEGTITVNLVKCKKGGVGFLASKSNASPFLAVSHVVKGGVAQETGLIEVGDVILEVNGKSLENVPCLKALEILDKVPTGDTMVLKIRARDGFQACLETAFDKEGMVKAVRSTKPKTTSESTTGMDGMHDGEGLLNRKKEVENFNGENEDSENSAEGRLASNEEKLKSVVSGGAPSAKTKTSPDCRTDMDEKVNGEKQEQKNSTEEIPTLNGIDETEQKVTHPDNKTEVRSESNGILKCPVTNAFPQYQQPKYIRLQNLVTNAFTTDTLHRTSIEVSWSEVLWFCWP